MGLTKEDFAYIKIGTLHEFLNSIYEKMAGFKLGNPAYQKVKDNVMTEYEEKFAGQGHPIHKLIAMRQ